MKQMIKLLILGFLSFIGCAGPETPIDNDQTSYSSAFTIPTGGNTYQIAGEENIEINQDGIKTWSSPSTVLGVFFKSSGAPEVRLNIDIESQEGESEIEIKINDTSKKITLQNGKSGIVKVGDFKLEAGYTKIEIKGVSKGGSNFSKIKAIKI